MPAAPAREAADEAASQVHAVPDAGPPPGPARADFESVRQRWPEILEAVKGQRRVAWMLLSNAAVDSVEDGVLTVRFAREGDVKGFSSSGCDRDLGQVLAAGFGFKLQVRAVFGARPSGPSAEYGQHSHVPAPAHPGQSDDAAPDPSDPARSDDEQSGPARPGSERSHSPRPGPGRADPAPPGPARSDAAQSDTVRTDAARSDTVPTDTVRSDAPHSDTALSGAAPTGAARPDARSGPVRSGLVPSDPTPTDRAPAALTASREDLTGMALIKRELGGRIIAEIDEA